VRVAKIVHEGIIEEHGLLRHDSYVLTQAVDGDVVHGPAIDEDTTFVHVVEPEQQAQ
jgi:hypothetical protein